MRILWLSKLYPAGEVFGGDLIYSAELARACAANGTETCVLTFAESAFDVVENSGLRWKAVRLPRRAPGAHLFSSLPSTAHRYASGAYFSELQRLLGERWDAIIVDSIAMGWIVPSLSQRAGTPPLVYLAHNDETSWRVDYVKASSGPKRLALRIDGAKAALLEKRLCDASMLISTITGKDAQAFQERHPSKKVVISHPGYSSQSDIPGNDEFGKMREAIVLGSFHWSAKQRNLLEFLTQSAAMLAAAQVQVKIVGDMPATFRQSLRQLFPEVQVTGRVDSFSDHVRSSRIGLIVDEIGGGFKLKSLDYVFHGLPIITLKGAMEGLPLINGIDYLTANTMSDIGTHIIGLIDDRPRLLSMRRSAFEKVRQAFSWKNSSAKLLEALSSAISDQTADPRSST